MRLVFNNCGLYVVSSECNVCKATTGGTVACTEPSTTQTNTAQRSACFKKRKPNPFPWAAPVIIPGKSATTQLSVASSDQTIVPKLGVRVEKG